MIEEKQIEEMGKVIQTTYLPIMRGDVTVGETTLRGTDAWRLAERLYNECYRKQEWISVEDRLPTEDEYLTHHNDGLDSLKRLLIAYQTDTIEYQIGCYDGYKWMNQLGNRVIKGVVAWKLFEAYEPPKMKGGAE